MIQIKKDLLGKGSSGKVYKAIDERNGSFVAIKEMVFVSPKFAISKLKRLKNIIEGDKKVKQDPKSAIMKEINLLQRLDHPNIVKYKGKEIEYLFIYLEYISERIALYIIMEYVSEGSLDKIGKLKNGFTEQEMAHYSKNLSFKHLAEQILTGLHYLHSQKVVHRDIKGANILLSEDGVIKLADFGVATHLTDNTKTQTFTGTQYWSKSC